MLSDKENNSSSRIQFLQQNVDKNNSKMHTCLQINLKLNINFILFQESFVNINIMTIISHSAYYYIMSESEKIRFRIMIFAKTSSRFQFCQKSDICSDTDIIIIDINDFLNLQNESDNKTFHKDNLTRASVIDLIFSTKNISQCTSW